MPGTKQHLIEKFGCAISGKESEFRYNLNGVRQYAYKEEGKEGLALVLAHTDCGRGDVCW